MKKGIKQTRPLARIEFHQHLTGAIITESGWNPAWMDKKTRLGTAKLLHEMADNLEKDLFEANGSVRYEPCP
jgi:hypothetical protein